jgi:NAD(P)H-quinone oxidoreductase subunit 5
MATIDPAWLAWCAPVAYLLAATYSSPGHVVGRAWFVAELAAVAALAAVLASAGLSGWRYATAGTPADVTGLVVATLITTLGWVIVRFSARYLAGERRQRTYIAALSFTLAAVTVVVLAQHLGVMFLAWIASSLGLHRLLTFYAHRPGAQAAAHKKFIASRAAELCLLASVLLIYDQTGTLLLGGIADHVAALGGLTPGLYAAAVLVALAVILKTAQLPVHGWIIQVMEAPTPVSALLHAGVVNLGGFVLIRIAMLLEGAPAAQALLVGIGGLTALLAGLVMMTRVSIKVRLAWSTCAQMGFMVMECGLGLYELAFLHLVAHSLYKAHAFLTAGDAVLETRRRALSVAPGERAAGRRGLWARLAAAPVAVALVWLSESLWELAAPGGGLPWPVTLIVGLGLAPLLWGARALTQRSLVRGGLTVLAITQVYLAVHGLFGSLLPPAEATSTLLFAWAAACLLALYVIQSWIEVYPRGALSVRLHPWAYAGFHLDEYFTRLTFQLWPVRIREVPAEFRVDDADHVLARRIA